MFRWSLKKWLKNPSLKIDGSLWAYTLKIGGPLKTILKITTLYLHYYSLLVIEKFGL